MINRKKLISKHNPVLNKIDTDSTLTVGNGDFAFTTDVTGMQSLYNTYKNSNNPLCTMSQTSFHTTPFKHEKNPTLDDIKMTEFNYEDRLIHLPVEKFKGDEDKYIWLRQNPHRPNLMRIALYVDGKEIQPDELNDINQELHLFEGYIESNFTINGIPSRIITACSGSNNILGFVIHTQVKSLSIRFSFPYGSHEICGSDWLKTDAHITDVVEKKENQVILRRKMDNHEALYNIASCEDFIFDKIAPHEYEIEVNGETMSLTVQYSQDEETISNINIKEILADSRKCWMDFWNKTGIVSFEGSIGEKANELERRIILSQYLLKIQSSGKLPPQETGLTCNSWHGKFHLEMHLWHSAWLPLYNCGELLEQSILWYEKVLDKAKKNASKNGFRGARWPKQVADDGIDSPSPISPLLIWQQPHIIYMLELLRQKNHDEAWMRNKWDLVKETTDFICDYLSWNYDESYYELVGPIIPAQEEHDPKIVLNPTFELEYFRFGLNIAVNWAITLGMDASNWEHVLGNLKDSAVIDNLYMAHENCPTTFSGFNKDHPSMLCAYGLIPSGLDKDVVKNTLKKVLECWDFKTMWGWDFAVMAMCATRLGDAGLAMDILLRDSAKNDYVASGNNYQRTRDDLPLYLPGNGSLLLAVAMMVAGYNGCCEEKPGIPKNGKWKVEFEGISPFPY